MVTVTLNGGQVKRAIIRGFWGEYSREDRILARKKRVNSNVKELMSNKYTTPFITYCYGLENMEMLINSGVQKDSIRLLCDEPTMFDALTEQYYHKIHMIQLAHTEFDIVLQCDWDVLPLRKWDDVIWDMLGKKESFVSNLYQYRRSKCKWRGDIDTRKLCNGGFTYKRD